MGDLDGDGLADLAVGAIGDDDGGNSHGAVWVLFLGFGCEGVVSLLASSGELSPFDSGFPQEYEFADLPEPIGDVHLTFTIRGDFDGTTELASIELNGTHIGDLLADDGEEFPETPQARLIHITLADFVELVPDGIATVAMIPSDAVSAACGELESFITVELTYEYISEVNDCNDNGTRDECDIASGTSQDCNENEVPDECDIADGTSQDDNGNGVPDECEACEGDANEIDPPSGTVDARQPHNPGAGQDQEAALRQGIGSADEPIVIVLSASGASSDCFTLCETSADSVLGANGIASVTEEPPGTHTIVLNHAIAPGGWTTISYGGGTVAYLSHPANANADGLSNANDVLSLIDVLNGVIVPPFGMYSVDIDHSGALNASDVLRLIDLLNGAIPYDVWNGVAKPDNTCP
ncbi:MAG: FG-GAP repeat protein [Planctomycetes bacterium]|nr:FG-GAP repeat protein [Planctomycetota bacterium]